ncbi:M14 family metallopeptidase [Patiriisocius hiemis]|uniref:M14 family metallopeptidase n=1 Tax=Patiriisocius hiemis TaxID=3075604 RepID=A0ABU2YDX4_9FLAO|nr:M14 family metallopeptidase [Constantimarinum sp. W242]MDT0555975.1 M14 family metallopeptidase [Constantimarinum sp. W242]
MTRLSKISYLFYALFAILLISCNSKKEEKTHNFTTLFEESKGLQTSKYHEIVSFYSKLSDSYNSVKMYELDKTDSGEPLHLITFNPNRTFESEFSGDRDKNILLINNGIHPGESDGIDASMMLIRDLANGQIKAPENTIVAVIPVYNIGGALNRNSTTRTNQNGPEEHGFRGNARNYDLNRDFIKADTKNARAFAKIFNRLKPDLFIDNHVSNGADYQYVLTHLFTQHNKLNGALGNYLHTSLMPSLEDSLQQKNWDITPYVNVFNRTPEKGFSQFMDSPRYSTGYTTLYNTLGMMVETHMLKPYKNRVEGTYELMKSFINIADKDAEVIKELRKNAQTNYKVGNYYPISWGIDSTQTTTLQFKGYEAEMIPSKVTNNDRLKYNRDKPFTKDVTYYNYFKPTDSIQIPSQYIIPEGYWNIVDLLKLNGITCDRVQKDTIITAEVYRIKEYKTFSNAYEGHYPHYNTRIEKTVEEVAVKKYDYVVNTQQRGVRYLLETLEPTAPDSFFNWNFFDTILQQKEGFSPYVWEDKAEEFLNNNPAIKAEFEEKKQNDVNFAKNWFAQLDWIHKKSPNYEKAHLRYPIIRVGS